ncbi:MAG: winged helix-turn-helix domain-containing protein [Deltaproteobacteria bacterium]|nr:winged helix-turn-helix domain-containing protein [Deltaproteobacteria bacterium]
METSTTAEDVKRALCVVLATEASWTAERIASLLRISRATVFRYRDEVKTIMNGSPNQPRDNWGGRRTGLLSAEEEKAFLVQWAKRALKGELISVKSIHSALIEIVGHNIPLSTVYKMLYRHNWRKVKPDTRHPKSASVSQEELKKNSQYQWTPPKE